MYTLKKKKEGKKRSQEADFSRVRMGREVIFTQEVIDHRLRELAFLNPGVNIVFVDERDEGRILMFNSNGELEWEYLSKDKNGKLYYLWWPRIIDNNDFIFLIRKKIKNLSCVK